MGSHRVIPRGDPPSSYTLASLPTNSSGDIEPPLITGRWINNDELPPNVTGGGAAPSAIPHGNPSVDITDDPGFIGRDTGMYNPNNLGRYNEPDIFDYQSAMSDWLDMSHPDDKHLFSFSDLSSRDIDTGRPLSNGPKVSLNDPNAPTITGNASTPNVVHANPEQPITVTNQNQYSPADFIGSQFQGGFDINRFLQQYPNFPRGPLAPNSSGLQGVDHGRVIVGGDDSFGYNSGQSAETNPNISDEQLIADQRSGLGLSNERDSSGAYLNTPQNSSQSKPRIDIGTSTDMNAQLGTAANPIYGRGSQSGNHYYNDGTGWKPIEQAPTDIRWAQNSGTGNFNATASTNAYVASGGDPGRPNYTGSTSDEGFNTRYYNPTFAIGQGSGAPSLSANTGDSWNNWLMQQPGYAAWAQSHPQPGQ